MLEILTQSPREGDMSAPLQGAADHSDWQDRILSIAGCLGTKLYLMGGQTTGHGDSAQADVYESGDGGMTWRKTFGEFETSIHRLPRSARGMVFGLPVIDNELYLCGGGRYDDRDPAEAQRAWFDGVYAFNGATWREVLREGHNQWPNGGRTYHNVVRMFGERLWLFTGSSPASGSSPEILVSDDRGAHWELLDYIDWGQGNGSHADAVTVDGNAIVRASGNAQDRGTYRISREPIPPKPELTGFAKGSPVSGPRVGPLRPVITLEGDHFQRDGKDDVLAVYVSGGDRHVRYAAFSNINIKSPTELEVKMPEWFPSPVLGEVFIYIVGPGGTAVNQTVKFNYM